MASIDTTPVPAYGHLPEEQDQWVGGQPVHGNQGWETLHPFIMGDPTGFTVETKRNWNPDSKWKKSPSQLKRDEKRRRDLFKNKNETNAKVAPAVKIEAGAPAKLTLEEVVDEINLNKIKMLSK
jgi:cytochrome oxidase assembly protein ShyY1